MNDFITLLWLTPHLMCMNAAAGGPLICAWLEWRAWRSRRARPGSEQPPQSGLTAVAAARYLAAASLAALFVGILLGLGGGWSQWTQRYARLWTEQMAYKVSWGILELGFSFLLMASYWVWRRSSRESGATAMSIKVLLLVLASTNLLYHFPALFLVARRLAAENDFTESMTARLFRQAMIHEEIPAMSVHFALASLAVAGVTLFGLSLRMKRNGNETGAAQTAIWGAWWGLGASLLQLPVGLWIIASLSPARQGSVMGGNSLATILFLAGIAGALWLLRELVAVAMGETARSNLIRAMTALTFVIFVMTATHQLMSPPRAADIDIQEGQLSLKKHSSSKSP